MLLYFKRGLIFPNINHNSLFSYGTSYGLHSLNYLKVDLLCLNYSISTVESKDDIRIIVLSDVSNIDLILDLAVSQLLSNIITSPFFFL